MTSVGFSSLTSEHYVEAVQKLRPDIALGLGDVVKDQKVGLKRMDKMGDRTLAWMKELAAGMRNEDLGTPRTALFAPILPIEPEQQLFYLDFLKDELEDVVSGLVLYDDTSITSIPETMRRLPRLSLREPSSPHLLLRGISHGLDIFTIPFIGATTDAGIALSFSFPVTDTTFLEEPLPLGIDMWSSTHATDLSRLSQNCRCYTCTNHQRAYLQHLLSAKEMLGWALLQLHNHHILDVFFEGVRTSISQGSFEEDAKLFEIRYTSDLPAKTGQGPR